MNSDSTCVQSDLSDIKREISINIVDEIDPGRREKLQIDIYELDESVQELHRKLLSENIPSVREAAGKVAKRKNLQCFKHNVLTQTSTIAKELVKPSMWIKIAQYFS